MTRKFDVVVIGTGAAGSTVASDCRAAGWQVAIVDSRPFGGTCALRGCDPKKVLVGAAEVLDWVRRASGDGVRGEGIRIDWAELMRFKRTFTEPIPARTEKWMRSSGVETFHGAARFVGRTALQVGGDVLEGRNIVIASGAKPADLNIAGVELLTTSDRFLDLDMLPERLIFVGGGYIAFEFSHISVRAGARVSVIQRGPRPLVRFDPDLVDRLVKATEELGVDIRLGAEVKAITRYDGGLRVHASTAEGEQVLEADMVVHSAGRVPDIDDLDLAAAGIERTPRGLKVNEYLQSTSNSAIYAAGDAAASGPPLTPVAGYEGRIVAENLLKGNRRKPNYRGIPSVVFTIPPLASVGLLEAEARERKFHFITNLQDTSSWYSSRRIGEKYSGFKTLVEEGTGQILGANLLGEEAGEVINLFGLAIRNQLSNSDLKDMVYSYPTRASDIRYML